MLHTISSHNLDALLTLVGRVAELCTEPRYQTKVTWDEIQLIDRLHSGIFKYAGILHTDLKAGRVKGYLIILSTEEVSYIASCLAVWDWFFPEEIAASRFNNEFSSLRFMVRDVLGIKI